jgi:AAA family ATP:ADP antiporter
VFLAARSDSVAPTLKALGLTPLMAAVLVGAAQNVFSKSAKYSLFDPCKEMAYIPLDDEVGFLLLLYIYGLIAGAVHVC